MGLQKQARTSFGPPYDCQRNWPEDCFVQAGSRGVVFGRKTPISKIATDPIAVVEAAIETHQGKATDGSYITAFFEAFPTDPRCFIRGEGSSIEAAESEAWSKFERYRSCEHYGWSRTSPSGTKFRNSMGFCAGCGMGQSGRFEELPPADAQGGS